MKLSIRKFLLLNLLLAITATMSLAALGNYYLDQKDIQNKLDSLLTQTALSFQTLLAEDLKHRDLNKVQSDINNIPNLITAFLTQTNLTSRQSAFTNKYEFQIWDTQGKLLLHSNNAPATPLAPQTVGFSDQMLNDQKWRVVTIKSPPQDLVLMVAENYNVRDQLAHVILKDDIVTMLLTYPLYGFLIWIIVGSGLSSIMQVAREVGRRAADHLDPVDLEAVPVEIKPLVDELNKLFLRLKQAFDREQRFSADAAHELRTPLAALRTQAQVALKTLDSTERKNQLQNVLTGVDRCTHVIQQLLTLCRLSPETSTLEDQVEVDLIKTAAEVVALLAPSAIEKNIDIELIATESACVVSGNATGLHILFRNLIDNAIRYTPPNGFVKIYVQTQGENILSRVVDSGPGIPPNLRSRVFERFFRVIGTKAQGSGLGLAIVQQIAKLHKGMVVLGAPPSGVGLEIEVTIPRVK